MSVPVSNRARATADWAKIARGAETLDERLRRFRAEPPARTASDRSALAGWARAYAKGDIVALERRLGWDGLDPAEVAAALSEAGERSSTTPLPEWLDRARRRYRLGDDWRHVQTENVEPPELPFAELWEPIVAQARLVAEERVEADAIPSRSFAALELDLAREIASVAARAAHERFERHRRDFGMSGCYRRYVESELASGLLEFAAEFPVALRQAVRLADDWIEGTVELAARIASDRAAVGEAFGSNGTVGRCLDVVRLRSDRHDGGRGIFRVRFAGAPDLVLKPRSLAVESGWFRLLERLAASGFPDLPPAARVLDRGTHGWMEWVEPGEVADRAETDAWFRRAGALVALAEWLGAEDLHAENVVATSRGPAIVDGEMLLQPDRPGVDPRQRFAGGLIRGRAESESRIASWAGLHPVAPRLAPGTTIAWRRLGSDEMHQVAESVAMQPLPNAARCDGLALDPVRHARPLLAGHRSTWTQLLERRAELLAADGALSGLAGSHLRLLFRPSQEYASVLDHLTSPRCQRDGTAAGILLEAMARPFAAEPNRPRIWPLLASERRALERLDVPRFATSASAIWVETRDGRVEEVATRSAIDAAARRLLDTDADAIDERSERLGQALEIRSVPRAALHAPGAGGPVERALELADRLAHFELERLPATAASAGSPVAAGRIESVDRRLRELALYDGRLGRVLALAAADRIDGGDRYGAVRQALFADLDRFADEAEGAALSQGGLDGAGALIWGLVAISQARGLDAGAIDRATRFARRFGPPRRPRSEAHDVLGGSAGMLLALLALAEATHDDLWLDRARWTGERLLEAARPQAGGGVAWVSAPGEPALTGFAHGAAGIARALAALWSVTGDLRLLETVGEALAFERNRCVAEGGDWPALRASVADGEVRRVRMTAYCHGAPGILLSRSALPPAFRGEAFADEVAAATFATTRAGAGDFDHLCCGAAGRIAALAACGHWLGDDAALAAAESGVRELLARAPRLPRSSRGRADVEAGLFRGLAGIAWIGMFGFFVGDADLLDPLTLELPSEGRARAALARANRASADLAIGQPA